MAEPSSEPVRPATNVPGPAEDFPFRVLLAVPEATTIPIFALGVEAGRDQNESRVTFSTRQALARVISGNLSRSLPSRYGEHRLIKMRRRVGERTASYSSWLAFRELAQAEALVRDHPCFGLAAIENKTRSEFMSREKNMNAAAANGRFNLGPLRHRARLSRAKEYVSEGEALDKLDQQIAAFATLRRSLTENPAGVPVG
jgi:hypothetical protein